MRQWNVNSVNKFYMLTFQLILRPDALTIKLRTEYSSL